MYPILVFHLLLVPWMSWEFRRRYAGNWPKAYSLALLLIPFGSQILAFLLFAKYQQIANTLIKKRNSGALQLSVCCLLAALLTAGLIAFFGALVWAVDAEPYVLAAFGIYGVLMLLLIVFARRGYRGCALNLEKA